MWVISQRRFFIFSSQTAVFLSDDMIDPKREDVELLRHAAVFAGIIRPLPDEPS
jgi:hypothetical protein